MTPRRPLPKRTFPAVAGALLIVSLLGSQAARAEKSSEPTVSSSGVFGIRLVEKDDGNCLVEATKDELPLWTLGICVGKAEDFYFISDDGNRFWVIRALGLRAQSKKASLLNTVVAALYDKSGTVRKQMKLSELVPTPNRKDVRLFERHFKWLQGVAGIAGREPRVGESNRVEFEVVGGQSHRLEF